MADKKIPEAGSCLNNQKILMFMSTSTPFTPKWSKGQRIRIKETYRDPGDEELKWIVISDEEKGRVDISPIDTHLKIAPVYTVQADWIEADSQI